MLAENVKYSDIVTYLRDGVASYCKNIDNLNSLPEWVRSGWGGYDKAYAVGSKVGNHGGIKQTGKYKTKITSGAVPAVPKTGTNSVQSVAETYMKFVNSDLSANITNAKVQAVYQAIISFCNDNIRIVSAICPQLDTTQVLHYYSQPVFIIDPNPQITTLSTTLQVKAADMLKSLGDFSTVVRTNTHPKLNTVVYSLEAYNTG